MKVVVVYARLYFSCLVRAFQAIAKNAWTLLLPAPLLVAFALAVQLAVQSMSIQVGGIVAGLIRTALLSCYLYFVGEVVARSKVSLQELKKSLGAYFWSVMGVYFILWILSLVLRASPQALFFLNIATLVLLNPAPEVIYLRGTRQGLQTIGESIRFLQEHWIEWFIPNVPITAAIYLLFLPLAQGALSLNPVAIALALAAGALLHLFMIFRGYLFQELSGSSHRQRMFKYRNAA